MKGCMQCVCLCGKFIWVITPYYGIRAVGFGGSYWRLFTCLLGLVWNHLLHRLVFGGFLACRDAFCHRGGWLDGEWLFVMRDNSSIL